MNNKQKLHQVKLTQWTARFQGYNTLGITCGDINISVSPTASEEKLLLLIKAVRYA